jgi:hypothetical protein
MPRKTTGLTELETRKQLLLVESELNRAQLVNELREFKSGLHQLRNQVNAVGSIASSAAKLTDTFSRIRNAFTHQNEGGNGKSWLSTLLTGAQTAASVFGAFRSRSK